MNKKSIIITGLLILFVGSVFSQNDKAIFKQRDFSKSFLYNTVVPELKKQENKEIPSENLSLSVDFKDDYPVNPDEYKSYWYSEPASQGYTGTCWCFSATSFMESEAKRISDIE